MGTDAGTLRFNLRSASRWLSVPRFSALHCLLFGVLLFSMCMWMLPKCDCVGTGGPVGQSFGTGFLAGYGSANAGSAGNGVKSLVCDHGAGHTAEYSRRVELRPQRGIEEADDARGTNMQLDLEENSWGIPMANSTLVINNKLLTFDEVLYGYDLIFENLALFSHTSWLGVGIQQDPLDAFALSALIWRERPDLLIEIGTNTGGGAIFYATVMREYDPSSLVLTIDPKDPSRDWARGSGTGGCAHCVDVRCSSIWNSRNIEFVQGLSSDTAVLARVEEVAKRHRKVLVMHDGSHFYKDVFNDLVAYDKYTSVGSYMVVQDTKMTRMYTPLTGDKFPMGAAQDFLKGPGEGRYVVDKQDEFLLYSQHHNGFLRKLRP